MNKSNLFPRDLYLDKLIAFQDTELVKVITGIRRCGKSSLLRLMQQHLTDTGISDKQIIALNFESMGFRSMTAEDLYEYVKEHLAKNKRTYLFFDEIQRIDNWQDAINSFRVDFDCDIYVTGSNAYLLSSEYATYLAGRCVEIKMLPLSFKEFLSFNGYLAEEYKSFTGDLKNRIVSADGKVCDTEELISAYFNFGGMPGIVEIGFDLDKAMTLLDGVYSTVVVRDILERERRRGQRQITDAELLRKIILFLADNIGNPTSINSIGNTLISEKLMSNKPAIQTLQAYIGALLESYVFYEIKRFDIKGKEYLRTLGKYYIVDLGLRNYLLGLRDRDTGHMIENVVYFELLRRGYDVAVGKIGNKEIDFIATNAKEKIYYQVTETMNEEAVRERELSPLRAVRDNYEKVVIARECSNTDSQDGISVITLSDFLLK